MMKKKSKFACGLLLFLAFIAASAAAVMLLWNALFPVLFGTVIINFWQALGLLVLARLLFGGFGFHKWHHSWHDHMKHNHHEFHAMHEKFHSMSHKDRRDFILRKFSEHGFCKENKETETEEAGKE